MYVTESEYTNLCRCVLFPDSVKCSLWTLCAVRSERRAGKCVESRRVWKREPSVARSGSSRQPAAVGRPVAVTWHTNSLPFRVACLNARPISLYFTEYGKQDRPSRTLLLAHRPLFPATLLQCLSQISSLCLSLSLSFSLSEHETRVSYCN